MRPLTLIKTLEYYDVPQILVAVDSIGTNYLCTLYKKDAESGYLYLGVQISETRLKVFTDGKFELRDAYVHPETDSALYLVAAINGVLNIVKPLQLQDITEEILPEVGYTYSIA